MQAVHNLVKRLPGAAKAFVALNPSFKKALASSLVTIAARDTKSGVKAKPRVSPRVISFARDLVRQENALRVGIIDMGAWIGGMPKLLERLNAAQPLFSIFEVQAPIPGGLLKTPAWMAQWASEHMHNQLNTDELEAFKPHVVANEFFAAG
ncbi:hypothetical protein NH8B_2426 [Pseudogulbenkiania sp. NH8B]|nr:hypothetical protein NH8B_2426 [Pseudogulbenkiania sp. NH8B]